MSFYNVYEFKVEYVHPYAMSVVFCEIVNSFSDALNKIMSYVRSCADISNYSFLFINYTFDKSNNSLVDSNYMSLTGFAREYKNKLEVKKYE